MYRLSESSLYLVILTIDVSYTYESYMFCPSLSFSEEVYSLSKTHLFFSILRICLKLSIFNKNKGQNFKELKCDEFIEKGKMTSLILGQPGQLVFISMEEIDVSERCQFLIPTSAAPITSDQEYYFDASDATECKTY
jgi:hypothetical protein